ncbi:MAG TPA: hypothetical protein VFT78_08215 [Hanamia sp.]|nr:hypothetical protein [Hanamia sp.]
MKKISLIVIFITSYSIAYCQLDKGTWLAGGLGSFNTYKENYTTPSFTLKNKYNEITLYPVVGFFLADKFAGGIRGGFSFLKEDNISSSGNVGGASTHSIQFSGGPFVRYYFLNSNKVYNILADACYQFGSNQYLGAAHEKGKLNTFSIMAGPEFFFNTAVGIEILIGYRQKVNSIDNSMNGWNSNKTGFQTTIGFQIHLQTN